MDASVMSPVMIQDTRNFILRRIHLNRLLAIQAIFRQTYYKANIQQVKISCKRKTFWIRQ